MDLLDADLEHSLKPLKREKKYANMFVSPFHMLFSRFSSRNLKDDKLFMFL